MTGSNNKRNVNVKGNGNGNGNMHVKRNVQGNAWLTSKRLHSSRREEIWHVACGIWINFMIKGEKTSRGRRKRKWNR